MSRLLAVSARELRERWLLFPAALVIGFFPFVLPAFGVKREDTLTVGLVGAVLLGAAAAVVIGSSMLARDAANGRLGFLFSRPVSWPAIWGGKWLAALVLVVASGFLAAIPWMAAFPLASLGGHHGDSWLRAMLDGPGAAFFFILIVLAVGLANFGGTLFRSRSPWAALDLVLVLAAFWAIRRYVAPLWWHDVLPDKWSLALALSPLALGLVAGSVVQVVFGRTDLRRAHRGLSLVFWAVIGVALVGAAVDLHWIRSAGPADVDAFVVSRGPGGRWAYVLGHNRRRVSRWPPHGCLVDTTSGRYWIRLYLEDVDEITGLWDATFSPDGRFVALPRGDAAGAGLSLLDLGGSQPRSTKVALEASPPPDAGTIFTLSPSAELVLMAHQSGVSLYALPSGRRVATLTTPPGFAPSTARFVSPDTARVWLVTSRELLRSQSEMRVVDLAADGSSRTTAFPTGTALTPHNPRDAVIPDSAGRRIVTLDGGLHLRDGATGDLIATLTDGNDRSGVAFLAGGRVVVGESRVAASETVLLVFDAGGVMLSEMRLELPPVGVGVGPEVAPGRIAVVAFRSLLQGGETLLVDVDAGRVVERLSGLRPAADAWNLSAAPPAGAGPTSVHYFRDAEGRVIRIDFATGERKIVAGPGAPRGERISVR